MRLIYLILICFAAPVAALMAWLRGLRDSSRRERLADRFGRPEIAVAQPTLWVHAASMGEVQAGAVLVRELLKRHPQRRIVMTTMTTTGAARVKSLFQDRVTHCYLPYDLPFAVRGFLDRVRPERALILETEMWPNLLHECVRRKIPVTIASARISPRTAVRYRRLRGLFADVLASGVRVAAQTEADAERFKALGATDVQVTGNIKFDIEIPDAVRSAGTELRKSLGRSFVWVAGSTHPGEEQAALDAHRRLLEQRRDALLILVPRHPQRFGEVRQLLDKSGVEFALRSSGRVTGSDAVLLVDTMGELLSFYAVADLAFVGGSLVPVGGHNLLEPAALGLPILCGPHMSNAQDVADRLWQTGAIKRVESEKELSAALLELAADANLRAHIGTQGLAAVANNRGAVERALRLVAG
jgi:3-deoxy-D-manno-octulosonic-acid transferase